MATWIFEGDFGVQDFHRHVPENLLLAIGSKMLLSKIALGDTVFLFQSNSIQQQVSRIWLKAEVTHRLEDISGIQRDMQKSSSPASIRLRVNNVRFDTGFIYKLLTCCSDDLFQTFVTSGRQQTWWLLSLPQQEALHRMWYVDACFVPFASHSWYIQFANIAIKTLDKSTFLHHMTGIPKEIRPFFTVSDVNEFKKREVTLIYEGMKYDAAIEVQRKPTPRTRLRWDPAFTDVLRTQFPGAYEMFRTGDSISTLETKCLLKFWYVNDKNYDVSFDSTQF